MASQQGNDVETLVGSEFAGSRPHTSAPKGQCKPAMIVFCLNEG